MCEIADGLVSFLTESKDNLLFIYGKGIALVPANQVVGYKAISE